MRYRMQCLAAVLSLSTGWCSAALAGIVDFEDLTLAPESFENGAQLTGEFGSRGAAFNNAYFPDFASWEGWAYSNVTDTMTAGFGNQYASFAGEGASDSANFGVAFTGTFVLPAPIVTLPEYSLPVSLRVTNVTYAALSMRDGDSFAKKFGGPSGDDADWFLLTIAGLDAENNPLGTVERYLADFRFADNAEDYILDEWVNVNLTSLAGARKLSFALTSSDKGDFGMNTPAYLAMDDLVTTAVPGDVNFDAAVDIFDVNEVSDHWGGIGPAGDANGDGAVDIFDVNLISDHWTSAATATVPEPPTWAIAMGPLLTAFAIFRRGR